MKKPLKCIFLVVHTLIILMLVSQQANALRLETLAMDIDIGSWSRLDAEQYRFQPSGTPVNFLAINGDVALFVITYNLGVGNIENLGAFFQEQLSKKSTAGDLIINAQGYRYIPSARVLFQAEYTGSASRVGYVLPQHQDKQLSIVNAWAKNGDTAIGVYFQGSPTAINSIDSQIQAVMQSLRFDRPIDEREIMMMKSPNYASKIFNNPYAGGSQNTFTPEVHGSYVNTNPIDSGQKTTNISQGGGRDQCPPCICADAQQMTEEQQQLIEKLMKMDAEEFEFVLRASSMSAMERASMWAMMDFLRYNHGVRIIPEGEPVKKSSGSSPAHIQSEQFEVESVTYLPDKGLQIELAEGVVEAAVKGGFLLLVSDLIEGKQVRPFAACEIVSGPPANGIMTAAIKDCYRVSADQQIVSIPASYKNNGNQTSMEKILSANTVYLQDREKRFALFLMH